MTPDTIRVIHDDGHLLAVDKPAGVASQGWDSNGSTVEQSVRTYLDPIDPSRPYLGTVHRLDRPVTGVMLWAKTPKAARRLAEQFAGRSVEKTYYAVVFGRVVPPEGIWDDWLCEEDTGLGVVQVCRPGTPRARQALTHFQVIRSLVNFEADCSLLRLSPRTGRTHQLRVQAASRGWPIVGDRRYGSTHHFGPGIALHARAIDFSHPTTQERTRLMAEWPETWRERGWVDGLTLTN